VFLAFLSAAELAAPLAAARADSVPMPDLETIRRTVRARLLAESEDTMFFGLRAMAAPIFDLQGRAALVATAIAGAGFPREADEAVTQRLHAACREATIEAGGIWPA
jgi:DNA-binding IclR family transcriptional regulator